jgi:hypothetical protein
VKAWRLHLFFLVALCFLSSSFADLTVGQVYSLDLLDVDGNKLSTADGHVTVVALASQFDIDRARVVGKRIPDHCLGNPRYRMITVITFQKNHNRPVRSFLNAIVRHRLNSEAQQLQRRYDQRKIGRNARADVHAVADFDGAIATKLGSSSNGVPSLRVFVFGRNGELTKKWDDVPDAAELAAALK